MLNVSHEINMNNIVFQSLYLRGDNRLMDQDSLVTSPRQISLK